jgi:carbonic anhydrase
MKKTFVLFMAVAGMAVFAWLNAWATESKAPAEETGHHAEAAKDAGHHAEAAVAAPAVHTGGHHAAAPAMKPAEAMQKIVSGNDEFVKQHEKKYYEGYTTAQHPFVTMITCSDARVHPTVFNADPVDHVFVIRNVGNQIQNSCGSIDYGIYHLHTPVLLILGHTHCGAVKAAMGNYMNESPCIINELNGLHLPLKHDNGEGTFEERWLLNVERNVDYQVDFCIKKYDKLVGTGQLAVVGAVYDFINAYGQGEGRLIITNINGITNPDWIKIDPHMAMVDEQLKNTIVTRKTKGH